MLNTKFPASYPHRGVPMITGSACCTKRIQILTTR